MTNTRKEPFELKLSVSTKTAKSKPQASKITEFETHENIPLTTGFLSDLFTSRLQSTNIWDKRSSNDTYTGMSGTMLDLDGKITITEMEQRCHKWHYILYTSTSHQTAGSDRFRVILPMDPANYDSYSTQTIHQRVYSSVKAQFPEIDKSCTTPASKFFPFCGDMANFEVKVHVGKDYWAPDFSARYINFSEIKGTPVIDLDTVVLDESKQPLLIQDIKSKTRIFCPFCDPEKRGNPDIDNAAVYLKNGVPHIYCSSCDGHEKGLGKKGVYQLEPNQAFELAVANLGVIVFRDIITDKYYLGEMSKAQDRYGFNVIGKHNIPNALATREIPIPDLYPEMEFFPDFASDDIVDLERGFVNKYIVPDVLNKSTVPGKSLVVPKNTELLTMHICGDDQDVYDLLINHLAYMVQNRVKTRVAYLFQGTQGTGKGVWFNFVLAQIFGRDYCADVLQKVFVKEFNMFLESNFCILVDEVEANFSETNNEITRVLKQVIADTHISVEGKGVDIRNGRNNANIFFATNKRNGVHIEPGDRRFIVAPRQEKKIYDMPWWTDDEAMIELLQSETEGFVSYLKAYQVDLSKVNRPFDNPAKEALIDLSKTNADYFFDAVKEGNWTWLSENIVPDPLPMSLSCNIENILSRIKHESRVSRDDLNDIYNNIHGKQLLPGGFTRLCKLHGLAIKQLWIDNANKMGVEVSWDLPDLVESPRS
ncbi:MAG: hypothetical protein H8D23_27505 [Candidatus Brocadiales bacterium]|nr:hypothetical protein [Candidatus Brocadiales bacterium]